MDACELHRETVLDPSPLTKRNKQTRNPQCYQDYKAEYRTVHNYPREEQRKTRAVTRACLGVYSVSPNRKGNRRKQENGETNDSHGYKGERYCAGQM